MNMQARETELEVRDLCTYFKVRSKNPLDHGVHELRAVDGVSFKICRGETLGLVGESGCGKTTLGKTIIQLYRPNKGNIIFEGQDLTKLKEAELRKLRRNMQFVFQDPYSSLNSRMTVAQMLEEPMLVHKVCNKEEAHNKALELLEKVGLKPFHINRYPHEFSGGQRQRISIARALTLNPRFIICDEPVSALDVSVQSQILNLLMELKNDLGLTYLFISHDLHVVHHISDRIGVMYLGRLVELGNADDICESPMHPYTEALFSASPEATLKKDKRAVHLTGELPSPLNPPPGCAFNTRCPYATDICRAQRPDLTEQPDGRLCACHLHNGKEIKPV